MYGKIIVNTLEELYLHLDDEIILKHYFGDFEINHYYKSPFEFRDDNNPSFKISFIEDRSKEGDCYKCAWWDYGISKYPKSGVNFVMYKFGASFHDAIQKIYDDIILSKKINNYDISPHSYKKKSADISLNAGLRVWKTLKDYEFDYWDNIDITKKELINRYRVYGGEVYYNNILIHSSKPNDPYFIYLFNINKKIWKAYRPHAKGNQLKFFGNNVKYHIQGLDLLEYKSDILFITKSYKDVIVLEQLGYEAIAPHTESDFIDLWELDYLKEKYKYIYVFFDNDNTGVTNSIQFTNKYNLNYINIPISLSNKSENLIIKDPYDVVFNHSYNLLNDIIIDKFLKDGV